MGLVPVSLEREVSYSVLKSVLLQSAVEVDLKGNVSDVYSTKYDLCISQNGDGGNFKKLEEYRWTEIRLKNEDDENIMKIQVNRNVKSRRIDLAFDSISEGQIERYLDALSRKLGEAESSSGK